MQENNKLEPQATDKHGLLTAPIPETLRKMTVPMTMGMIAILMFSKAGKRQQQSRKPRKTIFLVLGRRNRRIVSLVRPRRAVVFQIVNRAAQEVDLLLLRVERLFCRNERAVLRLRLAAGGHPVTLAVSGYFAGQRLQQYVRDEMMKHALRHATPVEFAACRFAMAALSLLPAMLWLKKPLLVQLPREEWERLRGGMGIGNQEPGIRTPRP